jgi:hypothetical protein
MIKIWQLLDCPFARTPILVLDATLIVAWQTLHNFFHTELVSCRVFDTDDGQNPGVSVSHWQIYKRRISFCKVVA